MTKLRILRSIPAFQERNSVLLKVMEKEKASRLHTQLVAECEATEVNVAPVRLPWRRFKAR